MHQWKRLSEQKIVQKSEELRGNLEDKRREVERQELALERHRLKVTDSETVSRIEREETRISMREAELSLAKARQDLDATIAKGDADVELLRLELRKQEDRKARLLDALESKYKQSDYRTIGGKKRKNKARSPSRRSLQAAAN